METKTITTMDTLKETATNAVNDQLEQTITQILAEQLSAQVLAIVGDEKIHELSKSLIDANLSYIKENPNRIIGLEDYDLSQNRYYFTSAKTNEDRMMEKNPVLRSIRNKLREDLSDKIIEQFKIVMKEKEKEIDFHQLAEEIYDEYLERFHEVMVTHMLNSALTGMNNQTNTQIAHLQSQINNIYNNIRR